MLLSGGIVISASAGCGFAGQTKILRLWVRLGLAAVWFFLCCTFASAQTQPVQSFDLNTYVPTLEGQWEGMRYASDGNVYFASSTQDAHHGAAFFKFNPNTNQLTVLAPDITVICHEDPYTNPQGKIHSDIVEANGWLYFSTHFASDLPGAYTTWTGSHLIGYQLSTGNFRDFGVIYPNYDSYSAVGVDPVRNYIYVFVTGESAGQVSYIFRFDAVTGAKTNLGQVGGEFAACLWMFVDQRGDAWFSPQYGNGALYRVEGATGNIDVYQNELPQNYLWNENEIDPSSSDQVGRYIQWMQPLDGNRAVFSLGGGMLYMFDSSKVIGSGLEFTNIQWIGYNYIGMAVGNNRVFWYQRANNGYGHQGDDAPPGTPVADFHLMSVSLDPATGYAITDHGLIQDQNGRLVWRVPSMMTDGHSRVFMTGDWWLNPGDVGTLQYTYTNGVESYVPLDRGEFFAMASHVIQDTLTIQSTPVAGAPITGTVTQNTNASIQLDDGTAVTLTAPATFTSGSKVYSFSNWQLNGVAQVGNTISFQLNANATAIAVYTYSRTSTVAVTPPSTTLYQGQTQQFAATVQNVPNQPVTWSFSPNVGTLSTSGSYAAPVAITAAQVVVVTATSTADSTQSATALIQLEPPVSVSVAPATATLGRYQPQQFTAAVQNSTNQSVAWTISPATGTISSTGVYLAPSTIASQTTVTVTATSVTDPTKFNTSVVTLVPSADHYVSPTGTPAGNGSMGNPWDLQTALNQPSSVAPGDIIWLLSGTYKGNFVSLLNGTATAPIIVRNFSGQRATLDGSGCGLVVLTVDGTYSWFWGLEVQDSADDRISNGACPAFGVGVYGGPGDQFINMVVHDTGEGFSAYNASPSSEFYGNIVYYNGFVGPTRNMGHGMYFQNSTGTKVVANNFVGDNAFEGIQIYGSGTSSVVGFNVTGNTLYNTDSWPTPNYQYNLIIAGGAERQNIQVENNYSYFPSTATTGYVNVGQYTPGLDATVTNNVFAAGYSAFSFSMEGQAGPVAFTGNVVSTNAASPVAVGIGLFSGQNLSDYVWNNNTYYGGGVFSTAGYDGNNLSGVQHLTFQGWQSSTGFDSNSTFTPSAPTGSWVYVQPNNYEPKRANITAYNWNSAASVSANLSGILSPGDQYVIQDAQNFYGPPVAGGIYAGGLTTIPMVGLPKAAPIGFPAPAHTAPQFGTFVVMTTTSLSPVGLSPVVVTLHQGQSQTFTAVVLNSPGQAVNWSISPQVGSISSAGVYVAPATVTTTQVVTVTATSTADSTKFGTATITLVSTANVAFVGTDALTKGNWQNVYGTNGYSLANGPQSLPSYDSAFTVQGQSNYTWTSNTTDVRALQNGAMRLAAAWYSATTFSFDVNLTDGNTHQISLYALDWDNYGGGRTEKVQVIDVGTNTVLDTRTISAFTNGIYLVWNISGHVKILVTNTGSNAALSAVFFDPVSMGKITPTITWTTPAPIAQGIALSATQLDATATVSGASIAGTFTYNPAAGTVLSYGSQTLSVTFIPSDTTDYQAASATVTLTVNAGAPSAQASFVGSDTTTQGSWRVKYGADGFVIANDSQSLPSYDPTFAPAGQSNYTWAGSTNDPRALQNGANTGRIAATWFSTSSFSFDVNLTDGKMHQVALYAVDWDNYGGRAENVQILDAGTGTSLDQRSISQFVNGVYLIWSISGHVKINVVLTGGGNAVVSGLFWGGASTTQITPILSWATPSAITYGAPLSGTQLNAAASYGGAAVPGSYVYTPAAGAVLGAGSQTLSVTFTPTDNVTYKSVSTTASLVVNQAVPVISWATPAPITQGTALSGTQLDATETANGSAIAGSFVYTPASGAVLGSGSQTLSVTFTPSDTVDYKTASATVMIAVNAAVSVSAQASFVGFDTATQGTWKGKYGADGDSIANDSQSLPGYAAFSMLSQSNYTWLPSSTDPRALQMGSGTGRIAATWFSASSFTFDVNLTDGGTHQIALYALDWDTYLGGRAETVAVQDASSGTVLDSRAISAFTNGIYLVWNVSGHVKIVVTNSKSGNAVVSGIFFGAAPQTAPSFTSATAAAFTIGSLGTFNVTAAGNPAPSITESGTPPSWLNFNPTTGALSGTPPSGTNGMYTLMFSASNGVGANASQTFTLTVNLAPAGATASFQGTDTATQGNWQGKYGGTGYSLANGPQSLPTFDPTFSVAGGSNYMWASGTADVRALQDGSGRLAATWFSATTFSFDINLTDANTHQVALYALDWDNYLGGRAEMVQVMDANSGATLDTESISAFTNGIYLVWNVSGHIKIVVTVSRGNAVISGVFFK